MRSTRGNRLKATSRSTKTHTRNAISRSRRTASRSAAWVMSLREAGAILYLIYSPLSTMIIALGGTYAFMKLNHVHEETALATACIVAASAFFEHASSERQRLRKERLEAHAESKPLFSRGARRIVAGFVILGAISVSWYFLGWW